MVDILYKVKDRLEECRSLLDQTMYDDSELTNEEFKLLRTIYDYICKVEDLFI